MSGRFISHFRKITLCSRCRLCTATEFVFSGKIVMIKWKEDATLLDFPGKIVQKLLIPFHKER